MAQNTPNIEFLIVKGTQFSHNLDVQKITDFPLALTYSIKDVQDPSSSKGSFSKTFSIPATKHNNTILFSLFSDSLYDSFQYIDDWDAQIFIDGMLVLQGKFQIKGTSYNGIAQSYECNVYGENFKWVNALSDLNLCDVDFSAGGFFPDAPLTATIGRSFIEDTWNFNLAGETIGGVQTHIVYPLVNTGKWNYTDGSGNPIVTPSDMSPAFYFYNMLKSIFATQGYTLESNFFETDWFKRLVSLVPKEQFVNSDAVIEQYSFEYENNTPTDFKTPLNYTDQTTSNNCSAVIGNTWHGQLNDSTIVCAICDPSNLITSQSITPVFDIQSPTNFMGLNSFDKKTIAGWYWGCYGQANNGISRLPLQYVNPCGGGQMIMGLDYGCVVCDISNTPTTTQSIPMQTDVFQTSYLGVYEFNISMDLEMDNNYELTDPVAVFDVLSFGNPLTTGTGNGGDGYGCLQGQTFPDGTYESTAQGTTYVFNMHLIHYKASTGRYHIVATESERIRNMSVAFPHLFCTDSPLSGANLTSTLSMNVQLQILDAGDKVFAYSEVTCEIRDLEDSTYIYNDAIIGLTQMKYKCNKSRLQGNLTETLVDGGSIGLNTLLPCDTSQMEWVNGLTGMFNLMWQSDEISKVVRVEPRDMFFDTAATAIDWTNKLDNSQDQKNEYIYDALSRNLCFTYENDSSDGFVEERNRRRGQICELGSMTLNLGELYQNDEQRIGSDFYAPTYMFYDNTIANNSNAYTQPFVPVIHSEYSEIWNATTNADLPDKVNDYSTRILIWYGLQPLNQITGVSNSNTWRWGYDNNSSPYVNKNTYPFAGVYCDQDGTIGGSLTINSIVYTNPSLYFENSEINALLTPAPYQSTNGLYDMFWEFNILTLMDRPVIKKCYFKLTPTDIANLDFRKLIYIRSAQADTYWILNKIGDYAAGKNQLTLVELFEYHNTQPLKSQFVQLETGFGSNHTPVGTDYNPILVANGVIKVPQTQLINNLGIGSLTNTPLLNKGTQSTFLPIVKQNLFSETNYFDDATRVPTNNNGNNSSNVGSNNNINVGSISVGNNISNTKSNQIVIGNGNNSKSNSQIEMTANGTTAFSINSDAIFREGGGGVVYYEDTTTGEIKEVMTGVPERLGYGKSLDYFYTRLTIGNTNII